MRDEWDIKGHQFDIVKKAIKHYHPWVRLSARGREMLSPDKRWRGRLMGIEETGGLRVRKAGQKSIRGYFSGFWEFDPDQSN